MLGVLGLSSQKKEVLNNFGGWSLADESCSCHFSICRIAQHSH